MAHLYDCTSQSANIMSLDTGAPNESKLPGGVASQYAAIITGSKPVVAIVSGYFGN
jgi:hypothetical protein